MRVVVLGQGAMLANLIEGVRDAGFDIVGVFRHERVKNSLFKCFIYDCLKSSAEYTLIKKYKLYEIKCRSANSEQFKKEILKLNADIILVGTWSEKLSKEIIDLPTIATINVHPSLLPKYRGPNPYIQTILNGETQSGVSFHLMSEKFDCGPLLAQAPIEISPFDTSKELKEKTVFQARLLLSELLKKINIGIVQPIPQDESAASYYHNISGDEKMLDFLNMDASQIYNTVRALHPYLPTYITVGKYFFIVNPYNIGILNEYAKAGNIVAKSNKTSSLTIACKDGQCIRFSGLKLYGCSLITKFVIKYLI